MKIRYIPAEDVKCGHHLADGYYVMEIGTNSLGDIILRCAYTPDPFSYPGTSIIYEPNELVGVVVE